VLAHARRRLTKRSLPTDALDSHVGLHPAAVRRGARSSGHETEREDAWRCVWPKSVRILDDIKAYLEARTANVLPKTPKGKRAATRCRMESVNSILRDGDLEIDITVPNAACVESRLSQKLDVLWERQRWTDSGGPDQLHHHVQKTRHRSVRLSARHFERISTIPAAGSKSCFPTNACCARITPTLSVSCRGFALVQE